MIKPISQDNISTRPFTVYKEWEYTDDTLNPTFGELITGSLFNPDTDPVSNGQYKRVVYQSVKATYYPNEELEDEIAVITIPPDVYGEGIKPGSLVINDADVGRIYTDDERGNLVSGSDIYGNVFYGNGTIVMTKDVEENVTLFNFTIDFRSTQTIYENEIFIPILDNEFNISQNPSSVDWTEVGGIGFVKYDSIIASNDSTISGGFADYEKYGDTDPTGSYLSTYITTIGLYDDEGYMVAVAKLPQPVKKLPNYPLNFIVRFDT